MPSTLWTTNSFPVGSRFQYLCQIIEHSDEGSGRDIPYESLPKPCGTVHAAFVRSHPSM